MGGFFFTHFRYKKLRHHPAKAFLYRFPGGILRIVPISYFINRKKITCVVSLAGTLTEADIPILQNCMEEIETAPARHKILNLSGLADVEPAMARPFTLFQQSLRSGESQLYLCGIPAKLADRLRKEGLIREAEVHPELLVALQVIMKSEGG